MRKLVCIGLAATALLVLLSAQAGAFTFEVGSNLAKMSDWGSFYDPSSFDAKAVGSFAVGDLDTSLLNVSDIYQPPIEMFSNKYYSGSPELSGLLSDLKIGAVRTLRAPSAGDPGKFEVDLVAAGRFAVAGSGYTGGRLDIWVDPANNLNPAGSGGYPNDWTAVNTSGFAAGWDTNPFDAGEFDTFPTVTDGTASPLLSGTLVSPNNDGVLLTLTLDFKDGTGSTNQGFIHLLFNNSGSTFAPEYLGGAAEIAFFNNFKFFPDATIPYEPVFDNPNTTPIFWATSSQDPINFTTGIPEPTTIALLGSGLVGLIGYARRRCR